MLNRALIPFTLLTLAFAGCGESQAEEQAPAAEDKAWPAGYDDSDCNLQTVLDPDKPGSPGNLIPSDRNPNGDSELAVLMREFVDDLRDARVVLQAGEQPQQELFATHRMMRCAWPTVPSDRDEGYDQRAITYLTMVRNFDANPSKDTYNALITSCVACHSVSCGGVIDYIESLRWQ